ncbi:MAG: hypothetical protein ACYC0Z_11130, partial [Acidobacteriaceae bacterium]
MSSTFSERYIQNGLGNEKCNLEWKSEEKSGREIRIQAVSGPVPIRARSRTGLNIGQGLSNCGIAPLRAYALAIFSAAL